MENQTVRAEVAKLTLVAFNCMPNGGSWGTNQSQVSIRDIQATLKNIALSPERCGTINLSINTP